MYTFVSDNNANLPISFSENDVFELQNYFLLPGLRSVRVKNLAAGRVFIKMLLPLFHPFSYTAYVGTLPFHLEHLTNLLDELKEWAVNEEALEKYLLTTFYYDFLFIEETKQLTEHSWYALFKALLARSSLVSPLPCIVLSYERE